jgi:hypothetical protein
MRILILGLLLLSALLVGCGGSASPSASGQPPRPSIDGVVVGVDSTGLNKVTSFTLRDVDGGIHVFKLDRLENRAEFPPGHLTEHQANADPVRVYFTQVGDDVFAIRIEDDPMPVAT